MIILEQLQWKVKHNVDFTQEIDVLETILQTAGVTDIKKFLSPTIEDTFDSFLFRNMKEGLKVFHDNLKGKIFIKVDCDVDGFTSAAYIKQFIQKIAPEVEIDYRLDFNKRHGCFYEDVAQYNKGDLSLIIVPDASVLTKEAKQIQEKLDVPILILDHHLIEDEEMLKYTITINNQDGKYHNNTLSGVGIVHKFCLAYCEEYGINKDVCNEFLDLVALGIIADSSDLRNIESRYYVYEGLKEENHKNKLIKEMEIANAEDLKFGLTITSCGWVLGPQINATIRYGKPDEQIDLFRALSGENEDREYQPRRKHKEDPKPPLEIHSLQKTMARVCKNVKQRQDSEVRRFMEKIDNVIVEQELTNNSVILIDGSDILTKNTVTGLVANKLASKYKRPVLILKAFNTDTFGGSGRNYGEGKIENLKEFLEDSKTFDSLAGHSNAFGVKIKKDKIQELTEYCNEHLKLSDLVTIHEVDYEVPADKLKEKDLFNVANAYEIWGNFVNEPIFAITNIRINASDINAYGENKGFIRFVYNKIPFIKKYCPKGDYDQMTLFDRRILGKNTKDLVLNVIGKFVLNEYEGKVFPQVKILYYDSQEYTPSKDELDDDFVF